MLTVEKIEALVLNLENLTPKTGKPSAKAKKAEAVLISSKEEILKVWQDLSPTAEQKLDKIWRND